jgi:phosphoenolpyruvate-protein kinase (PTS system EI component)
VRLLLRDPDLLDTQFNALLEFSRGYDVRILVPMVTLAEDMAKISADSANWHLIAASLSLSLIVFLRVADRFRVTLRFAK